MQPMFCKAFNLSKYPRLQCSHSLVAFFLRRTVGRSDCSISRGDVSDVSLKEAGNDEDGIIGYARPSACRVRCEVPGRYSA